MLFCLTNFCGYFLLCFTTCWWLMSNNCNKSCFIYYTKTETPKSPTSWRGNATDAEQRQSAERKRGIKPFLPSIIMRNMRSLTNKTDELEALTRTNLELQEYCLKCFTEPWLQEHIDFSIALPRFQTKRAYREMKRSEKSKGGGNAVLVNKRWCNPGHSLLEYNFCSPNMELLAVSFCHYLPREFTCVVVVVVYIPPSAGAHARCDIISSAVAKL